MVVEGVFTTVGIVVDGPYKEDIENTSCPVLVETTIWLAVPVAMTVLVK